MATVVDAADARFLALLTKSADRGLVEAAETVLASMPVRFVATSDLEKVGYLPKDSVYAHGGWRKAPKGTAIPAGVDEKKLAQHEGVPLAE